MPKMGCLGGTTSCERGGKPPSEPPQAAQSLTASGVCFGALPAGDCRNCSTGHTGEPTALVGAEAVGRLLNLPADALAQAIAVERATGYAVRAPRAFLERIHPGDLDDPLLAQIWPRHAETANVPGYTDDPLDERQALIAPNLIKKYPGRALLLATDRCPIHCRFCFRRHRPARCGQQSEQSASASASAADPGEGEIETKHAAAFRAIEADRSLAEVILSGGDPLTLSDDQLGSVLRRLSAIAHLRRVRIHTRTAIVAPQRVTAELVGLLRAGRLTPYAAIHVNHPRELAADAAEALARLVDAGVPLLSQTVLLAGVNDRVETLAELFERLVDLRVVPYYLHQLDPVAGAAHFAVEVGRGRELIGRLRARLPGYAVPRYVQETPGAGSKFVMQ